MGSKKLYESGPSRVYGSPLGAASPSPSAGRPKVKDPDVGQVRAAMKGATTNVSSGEDAAKRTRGSSLATGRQRVLRRTEEEIEKQSR